MTDCPENFRKERMLKEKEFYFLVEEELRR